MQTIANFFHEFWRQASATLRDLGDWMISVFDPNAGPWPKVVVGGIFLLVALIVVSKTSKAR